MEAAIASRLFALLVGTTAMLLAPVPSSARHVKLGSISFDLPDRWKVESDRVARLVASPSGQPYAPPLVMAELCLSKVNQPCQTAEAPDEKLEGCANPQLSEMTWPRGFREHRWTCSRGVSPDGAFIAAVSYFETSAWSIRVAYISTDKDKQPGQFFDELAESLRQR